MRPTSWAWMPYHGQDPELQRVVATTKAVLVINTKAGSHPAPSQPVVAQSPVSTDRTPSPAAPHISHQPSVEAGSSLGQPLPAPSAAAVINGPQSLIPLNRVPGVQADASSVPAAAHPHSHTSTRTGPTAACVPVHASAPAAADRSTRDIILQAATASSHSSAPTGPTPCPERVCVPADSLLSTGTQLFRQVSATSFRTAAPSRLPSSNAMNGAAQAMVFPGSRQVQTAAYPRASTSASAAASKPKKPKKPKQHFSPPACTKFVFISFDIETTGLLYEGARLIELALVSMPAVGRMLNPHMEKQHQQTIQGSHAPHGTATHSEACDPGSISAMMQSLELSHPNTPSMGSRPDPPSAQDSSPASASTPPVPDQQSGLKQSSAGGGGGAARRQWATLVHPGQRPPVMKTEIHRITWEMLEDPDVPRLPKALSQMVEWVTAETQGGSLTPVLVAHNGATFDIPFLMAEAALCSVTIPSSWMWLDMLALARTLKAKEPEGQASLWPESLKLEYLQRHYGVNAYGQAHRALADAHVLADILECVLTREQEATGEVVLGLSGWGTAKSLAGYVVSKAS